MNFKKVHQLIKENGITVGSVESFTGGLFASTVTSISGASGFFKGTLVTYATEEKEQILKIPHDIVTKYGVVSKEIAHLMAVNGKMILGVDYCLSFTGNAGPNAMENKPVGEVYIALASQNSIEVKSLKLHGSRRHIRKEAVKIAYQLIWEKLKNKK